AFEKDEDFNRFIVLPLTRRTIASIEKSKFVPASGNDVADQRELRIVRLALLFHDLGFIGLKEEKKADYSGVASWDDERKQRILNMTYPFFGLSSNAAQQYLDYLRHPFISGEIALQALGPKRLNLRADELAAVLFLVEYHAAPIELATYGRLKNGLSLDEFLETLADASRLSHIEERRLMAMLLAVQMADAAATVEMAEFGLNERTKSWVKLIAVYIQERANQKVRRALDQFVHQIDLEHQRSNDLLNQLIKNAEYIRRAEILQEEKINIVKTYMLAYRLHLGQYRQERRPRYMIKQGYSPYVPYVEHVIAVAEYHVSFGVTDAVEIIADLLH